MSVQLRLSLAARAFVLLAVGGPILWSRDVRLVVLLGGLALASALFAALLESPRSRWLGVLTEAAVTGVVCGVSLDDSSLAGLLVIPFFTSGLYLGARGTVSSLTLVGVTTAAGAAYLPPTDWQAATSTLITWGTLGLGLGMVATFVRGVLRDDDPLAPYRHASALLQELNDLSIGLSAGLDPRSLGGSILSTVLDEIPASAVSIHVPLDDHLTTLAAKSLPGGDLDRCADLATTAWAQDRPHVSGDCFAFPLVGHRGTVAVVSGTLAEGSTLGEAQLRRSVSLLQEVLVERSVPLETGLLFEGFRDTATADERQRLSREMHDGVAQDIASLGYVVDALAAQAPTPESEAQLLQLRERVSAIVAEVRRSVTTLRTSVGTSESLGSAIIGVTRNLSQTSGIPIEVTLDEQAQRLRPEVEAELFRITQEALNNAVKHAGATAIRVHCQVAAPHAAITVRDDGRGLGEARTDSYGLGIMRERARLVGAELRIEEPAAGGVSVSVRLGPDPVGSTPDAPDTHTPRESTTDEKQVTSHR